MSHGHPITAQKQQGRHKPVTAGTARSGVFGPPEGSASPAQKRQNDCVRWKNPLNGLNHNDDPVLNTVTAFVLSGQCFNSAPRQVSAF